MPIPEPEPPRSAFDLCFGIILPFAAIAVELLTRLCASALFDPLPTPVHVAAALVAPISALAIWLRVRWPAGLVAWTNAAALTISASYAIRFLPLVPLGILGSVMLLGLLPLAPFFAFATAVRQRRALEKPVRPLWQSVPVVLIVLLAASLPQLVTRGMLHWSLDAPEREGEAARIIRLVGSESALFEATRARGQSPFELFADRIPPAHARSLYYRVTGENSDRKPVERWHSLWDAHVGTSTVGGALADLAMDSSQIDASIDPVAALGYYEWTMTFHNSGAAQREARAVMQLPSGGVVSRATLWINGEPREAAFGGRAATTAAYRKVVSARRDPLLVTTAGPDRVLVQCFPVPANGEMKIRIGVTAPVLEGPVMLPYFEELNFTPPAAHSVWIDSARQTLRTRVADRDLRRPLHGWKSATPATLAWTPDPFAPGHVVRQRIVEAPRRSFGKLIYVVDGSAAMAPYAEALGRQLRGEIILASDEVRTVSRLSAGDFAGGADNVPALLAAQDRALAEPDAAIVWIHGPQSVALSNPDPLRQFWTRRPGNTPLYSIQLEAGPHPVLAALDGLSDIHVLRADPDRVIGYFEDNTPERRAVLERIRARTSHGHRTSAHLARLWAFGESARASDAALAATYQLVTPLTGAVVLESAAQHQEAGLAPAAPATVPTVPEPETWALMLVSLGALLYAMHRRQAA
ncbi:MAG: VIT domain-containing protein [Bryobacteraceae bacterium]